MQEVLIHWIWPIILDILPISETVILHNWSADSWVNEILKVVCQGCSYDLSLKYVKVTSPTSLCLASHFFDGLMLLLYIHSTTFDWQRQVCFFVRVSPLSSYMMRGLSVFEPLATLWIVLFGAQMWIWLILVDLVP